MDMSHCDWIYNVLEGKKETELRVFENEHFMLQKDWKFNEGDDLKSLYCLAITKRRDLHTIRDLTAADLPMLKSILAESIPAMTAMFKVPACQITAYFHYQPTYYHMHVHFVHVEKVFPSSKNCVDLATVIFNLELSGDYYQKAPLSYKVGNLHPLYEVLVEKDVLPKVVAEEKVEVKEVAKEEEVVEKKEEVIEVAETKEPDTTE
jgi:m7GpppX diphosphatase